MKSGNELQSIGLYQPFSLKYWIYLSLYKHVKIIPDQSLNTYNVQSHSFSTESTYLGKCYVDS